MQGWIAQYLEFLKLIQFRAIELSLKDIKGRKSDIITISDSDSDDGDERFQQDLRNALQASQEIHQGEQPIHHVESSSSGNTTSGSAFMSERATLERARLERQKRLRPERSVEKEGQSDTHKDEEDLGPPAKRHHAISGQVMSELSKEPRFWDGELRQTATIRSEPRKDGLPTFRLTEILGKVLC